MKTDGLQGLLLLFVVIMCCVPKFICVTGRPMTDFEQGRNDDLSSLLDELDELGYHRQRRSELDHDARMARLSAMLRRMNRRSDLRSLIPERQQRWVDWDESFPYRSAPSSHRRYRDLSGLKDFQITHQTAKLGANLADADSPRAWTSRGSLFKSK